MDWWVVRRPNHDWAQPKPQGTGWGYIQYHCHHCEQRWSFLPAPPCIGGLMWNPDVLWGLRFLAAQFTIGGIAWVVMRLWRVL